MWRRVPLLLLVYVTLDFANPLMPGAVRFEGGSIEVVPASRAARTEAVIVTPPATLPTAPAARKEAARAWRTSLPPAVPARALRVVRRPPLERSAPSPSPTEDH
ncbi:MAG: hypothetical protein ACREJR_12460 [Candidatus Rokuibacteriota bacterium]